MSISEDLLEVTNALISYENDLEKNRNYIVTGKTTGSSGKGTNYNIKAFKYLDDDGSEKAFIGTPIEYDNFVDVKFGGIVPKTAAPDAEYPELKSFTYTDPKTDVTKEFKYSQKALDNWLVGEGLNYSPVNINRYFALQAEGMSLAGSYGKNEIENTKQKMFGLRVLMNKGAGPDGGDIETNPISNEEAQLAIDFNAILDDYQDWEQDDMVLGKGPATARLNEVTSIYNSYLKDIQDNNITPSRVKYYNDKLEKTEENWTNFKSEKMKVRTHEGETYSAFDPKEFNAAEYIDDTYGKNQVMYVHPETKEYKIGPANANVPGSPLEGYTPMGNITGQNDDDMLN